MFFIIKIQIKLILFLLISEEVSRRGKRHSEHSLQALPLPCRSWCDGEYMDDHQETSLYTWKFLGNFPNLLPMLFRTMIFLIPDKKNSESSTFRPRQSSWSQPVKLLESFNPKKARAMSRTSPPSPNWLRSSGARRTRDSCTISSEETTKSQGLGRRSTERKSPSSDHRCGREKNCRRTIGNAINGVIISFIGEFLWNTSKSTIESW